jgi:hypothetical protein
MWTFLPKMRGVLYGLMVLAITVHAEGYGWIKILSYDENVRKSPSFYMRFFS